MFRLAVRVAVLFALIASPAFAATYYVDPAKGSPDGDGSQAKPWKTLEQVAKDGHLGKLQGGDTVLLASGYHGAVSFGGENSGMVTIAADKNAKPQLSRLTITSGKNWTVRGLTVSPSFAESNYKGNIVTFAEGGDSSDITIEDCFIYTTLDTSKWTSQDWMTANSGIFMGRHGKNLTLRNNYVLNTRFGISLCAFDSLCEGNVVSDFSADGIRMTRDGQTVRHNVIKNIYVSADDGDKNHDDGIQCFLFNKGKGTLKNLTVTGNIIVFREDPNQKWPALMQGIGFFDGPLVDFNVSDNVVFVEHYHGISLYDAQNAKVERNVVWSPPNAKTRAWIMFGTKVKQAHDNQARNNYAPVFKLKQPGTVEEKNQVTSAAVYKQALAERYQQICEKFGARHATADLPRLRGN